MIPTTLHTDPTGATEALARLGLQAELLRDAVRSGYAHRNACTSFDAPSARGYIFWDKTLSFLREHLADAPAPNNWLPDDFKNYSTVIHPEMRHALAVAGGNANVGTQHSPTTRTEKGAATRYAVRVNQYTLGGEFSKGLVVRANVRQVWLLLYCYDKTKNEIRIELSLPRYINDEGYITSWHERIIIEPLRIEPTAFDDHVDTFDEYTAEIRRRTG